MDDPERLLIGAALLVCVVQRRRDRVDHRDDQLERDLFAALEHDSQQTAEVLAMHVLHREVRLAALLADVEHLDDVVVMERGGEPGLRNEHVDERRIVLLIGADPLDHDVPLEALETTRAGEQ